MKLRMLFKSTFFADTTFHAFELNLTFDLVLRNLASAVIEFIMYSFNVIVSLDDHS